MFKSIAKLFKGSEVSIQEGMLSNEFQKEQENMAMWFKVLNLHFGEEKFFFLVDYSKEEMLEVSNQELEIHAVNFNTQFVFELSEDFVVNGQNIRRVKKLLTALYKYYNASEVQINNEESIVFNGSTQLN